MKWLAVKGPLLSTYSIIRVGGWAGTTGPRVTANSHHTCLTAYDSFNFRKSRASHEVAQKHFGALSKTGREVRTW